MSAKNIYRSRGLKIYSVDHPAVKKLLESNEDSPEIHGDKVWFSSYFIMDYLKNNPPKADSKIMEIGSGWGLLSVYCAQVFEAQVTAVDADKYVFPFLDLHAELNKVSINKQVARYENLTKAMLKQQDLILGADICFWDELVDPLMNVINKACSNENTTIILADPGRSPFLELAKKCKNKFNAELIDVSCNKPTEEEGYLLLIET